jgi:hypothetical protein
MHQPPRSASLCRRLVTTPTGPFAVVVLALVVLSAIFAPLLAPTDPNFACHRGIDTAGDPAHPRSVHTRHSSSNNAA